ncbi:MAG TPA: hypothetical protein PK733_08530 [Clostridiales bacterium]|nr:hypothetical protein [Clostridiales bacterium]
MIPVFLQGCGADIKPYITADNDRFKSCNYEELEEAVKSLAKEIQGLIENSEEKDEIVVIGEKLISILKQKAVRLSYIQKYGILRNGKLLLMIRKNRYTGKLLRKRYF